jgi:hypothetical protein
MPSCTAPRNNVPCVKIDLAQHPMVPARRIEAGGAAEIEPVGDSVYSIPSVTKSEGIQRLPD